MTKAVSVTAFILTALAASALGLAASAGVVPATAAQSPVPSARQVDAYVERGMADLHIPGAAVALFSDGRVTHVRGLGRADDARQFAADVELDVRIGHEQRLSVGVDGDELGALEAHLDHAVNGVHAATANADDLDRRDVVLWSGHGIPFNINVQLEGYSYVKSICVDGTWSTG